MTTATLAPLRIFREATTADVPRLAEMFERFRAEGPYAAYGPAQPDVSTALIELLITHDDGVILVTARDDRLVGMLGVMVSAHPWTGERMATELFWWLEPEHRGDGVWLLRRAERWAAMKGAVRLLMVSPQSPGVDRLYAELGYAPVETSWQKSLTWFDRHAPRPRAARRLPHGILVHDDVLSDPMAYRAMALQQRFQAVHDGPVTFQRLAPCADPVLPMWIVQHYPQLTPTLSFFRQGAHGQPEPHLIHDDRSMGEWTCLLYLTPQPPDGDGTAFYRHLETGDVGSGRPLDPADWFDESLWQPWRLIDAQFNRLVLFPAARYHSRAIRENYGLGDDARLLQVCFGTGSLS